MVWIGKSFSLDVAGSAPLQGCIRAPRHFFQSLFRRELLMYSTSSPISASLTPSLVLSNSVHGSQECDGNVQQLCVRDSEKTSQRDWWNFIQCQNFQDIKRVGDLSLAKQCAKVIKMDWDAEFSGCYTGARGAKLLRDSGELHTSMNLSVLAVPD